MEMEKLLRALFDYQRFERDAALQSIMDEESLPEVLADDDLELLAAAGDPYAHLEDGTPE